MRRAERDVFLGYWGLAHGRFRGICDSWISGAVIATLNWPTLIPGVVAAHAFWHCAVLVGLALHWRFVFQFAAGPPD